MLFIGIVSLLILDKLIFILLKKIFIKYKKDGFALKHGIHSIEVVYNRVTERNQKRASSYFIHQFQLFGEICKSFSFF